MISAGPTVNRDLQTLRKTFLRTKCRGNFLKGMGGPGAPHVFAFDRWADVKRILAAFIYKCLVQDMIMFPSRDRALSINSKLTCIEKTG